MNQNGINGQHSIDTTSRCVYARQLSVIGPIFLGFQSLILELLLLITWLYRFAITNDFYIFLNLNIIRIFVILKKSTPITPAGFLLVASHLLQYIGEDKKVFFFSRPHTRSESWYSRNLIFTVALLCC
jgi:hypothetical protein